MKNLFILALSFVFVAQIYGQGFLGTHPAVNQMKHVINAIKSILNPIKPLVKPINPVVHPVMPLKPTKPVHHPVKPSHILHKPVIRMSPKIDKKPVGKFGKKYKDPKWIRDLIGNTITGKAIIGGQGKFPRHGGAGAGQRFANGLRNGWGGDPDLPTHESVSAWQDPLDGHAFPSDYSGGDLVFDDKAGHYVAKSMSRGGNSGYGRVRKPAKLLGGIGGHDPIALEGGHRIAKEVFDAAARTIDIGSHGELSRGNHFAHKAAEGLAKEMVHVAGKKLEVASSVGHLGHGIPPKSIHHPGSIHVPVHKPVHKPIHKPGYHPKPALPIHSPVHPIHTAIHKPKHKPILKPVKPLHKQIHSPIHNPIHKQIHKPVHPIHKPIHLPVHKPVHKSIHKPMHKPGYLGRVHPKPALPVHKPIHKPVHKPVHPIHPKPVHPKQIHPKPVHPKPFGGLGALQGGGLGHEPEFIRNLIGSTIRGAPIRGGFGPFIRHGGAGIGEDFKEGLRNGYGADPLAPAIDYVSSWIDPLDGRQFPENYAGGELVLDDASGHYVLKSQAAAAEHHVAKSTGLGHVNPVIGPVGHPHVGIGKPISGGDPVHNVHKVAQSGIVAARHDPLAVEIGHKTATHIAGKASQAIDRATGGALSAGDPFANRAAHGLAAEAAQVTGEKLALASAGAGTVSIHGGLGIHGGRPIGHIAPIKPPVHHQPFPTGYGGRRRGRRVVAAKTW